MQQTKTLTISNDDEMKDTRERERVIDYISNLKINKTPEEVEAVQPFSKAVSRRL